MHTRERGSSLIEFTLVAIPIMFLVICVFEISRCMWVYQTMAHAIRETARYSVVRGKNCQTNNNACSSTISQIADQVRFHGTGLDSSLLEVTFRAGCTAPSAFGTQCSEVKGPRTLQQHLDDNSTTAWPPGDHGGADTNYVEVQAVYPFRSALAMFWPGAGSGLTAAVTLTASSREMYQF